MTPAIATAWACGGALLFALFIVYDTHILLTKLGPDDYIFASINLCERGVGGGSFELTTLRLATLQTLTSSTW
jgi:hypothetical protein